jgi:hypothetical protein
MPIIATPKCKLLKESKAETKKQNKKQAQTNTEKITQK